jgi:hypothetical protein
MDDAGLSAAAVTFSPGEKFIEDCPETQFFTGSGTDRHGCQLVSRAPLKEQEP